MARDSRRVSPKPSSRATRRCSPLFLSQLLDVYDARSLNVSMSSSSSLSSGSTISLPPEADSDTFRAVVVVRFRMCPCVAEVVEW
jgi:hypothetical protein